MVKRFQTIHHYSVDVAHGLVLLFGIEAQWVDGLGVPHEMTSDDILIVAPTTLRFSCHWGVKDKFCCTMVSYWLGLMAPAGTPRDIIDRLAAESVAVLTTRDTRESLAGQGAEVVTSTPDELKKLVEKDVEKWSKIIQETGITAE